MKRADAALTPGRVPGRERTVRMLRVLLAEEKELAGVRLQAQLERLGHRVVRVAHDGKEAVEAAWMLDPDLIIMNIRLPVIDGITAAQAILRRRAIPIILLTAYLSADLGPRARDAGVMAHLVKPVDGGQLRSTITLALARFEELQALRREGITLRKALETRTLVERAKRVLMKELKLSEVEAFRRMQDHRQSTNKSLHAIASTIVKADELLVRRLDFAKCLQGIHRAIRPGLREVASMTKAATTS